MNQKMRGVRQRECFAVCLWYTSRMKTEVRIPTSDGVLVTGDYMTPETAPAGAAVLLLHMMPSDRASWSAFMPRLAENGYASLAIDLRGHGKSRRGPDGRPLDYETFSDEDHQRSIHDVISAAAFLEEKGHRVVHVGGASIGANLALWYGAEYGTVASVFLLSPGIDYRGIKALPRVAQLAATALFIAASKDDVRSGGDADVMARQIYEAAAVPKEIEIFETGGHGTDMFRAHPELMDALIQWMRRVGEGS